MAFQLSGKAVNKSDDQLSSHHVRENKIRSLPHTICCQLTLAVIDESHKLNSLKQNLSHVLEKRRYA